MKTREFPEGTAEFAAMKRVILVIFDKAPRALDDLSEAEFVQLAIDVLEHRWETIHAE